MITTLDSTIIGKINTQSEFDEIIKFLDLKSDSVIIKPNWVDCFNGTYTDAKVLDLLFNSLKNTKIYLVESYTFWRNQYYTEQNKDSFSSKEADLENGKQHWQFFKDADDWFLNKTGINKILAKHNVTYINVTNELWSGRVSENKIIPQILIDLKGSDFISFAKLKGDGEYGATLSIKNMFGLYPDPHRIHKYHGDNEEKIEISILNINGIYRSLFNLFYLVEGVYTSSSVDWGKQDPISISDLGIILGGKDAVQTDHTALKIMNRELLGPIKNLLNDYQNKYGGNFQSLEIPSDYKINFPNL